MWNTLKDLRFFLGKDCNSTMNQDGNWGQWGAWSTCSATCGSGIETRKRFCNDPKPSGDGQYCSKDGSVGTETRPCPGLIPCSLGWSPWSDFGSCSVTCGSGLRTRTRECLGDTSNCPGTATDSIECDAGLCWSQWSDFGPCSVTCGLGVQTRSRTCLGDPSACPGEAIDGIQCDAGSCWSQWSDFGPCSVTCGLGLRTRTRTCLGDPSACPGVAVQTVSAAKPELGHSSVALGHDPGGGAPGGEPQPPATAAARGPRADPATAPHGGDPRPMPPRATRATHALRSSSLNTTPARRTRQGAVRAAGEQRADGERPMLRHVNRVGTDDA